LITTDCYSNFFELDILTSTTARAVINKLKPHLARYGLPERLATDNGPQLDCAEFQKFAAEYQFEHVKTSPRYPQSNGKAENSVKTAKSILKKAADASHDPHLSLLHFRKLIHHKKEWTAPLDSVSFRVEPVPHYQWLATCFSQKSFPMFT